MNAKVSYAVSLWDKMKKLEKQIEKIETEMNEFICALTPDETADYVKLTTPKE